MTGQKEGKRSRGATIGIVMGSFATLAATVAVVVVVVLPDRPQPSIALAASASAVMPTESTAAPSSAAAVHDAEAPVPKTVLDAWVLQATPVSEFEVGSDESWALLPPGTTDCGTDVDGKITRLDKPSSADEFDAHQQEQQRSTIKEKYVGRLVSFHDKDIDVRFSSPYNFAAKTLQVTIGFDSTPSHVWPLGGRDPTFRQQTDNFETERKIGELGGKDLKVTGQETLITYDNVSSLSFTVHVDEEHAKRWKNGNGEVHATLVQRFLGLGLHKVCQNNCAVILGTTTCGANNVGVGEYNRAELIGYRITIDDTVVAEKQPASPPPSTATGLHSQPASTTR